MLQLNFTPFPNLTTERLLLRQLTLQDANEIFLLRSDENVNEFVERPKATSIEDAINFINKINTSIKNNEALYWAITLKNKNKLIGTFTFWNISKESERAEIGYELLPEFQRKGIMHEAISKIIEYGFDTVNLKIIEAWTHTENKSSLKLLEKNNFIRDIAAENERRESANEIIYSLTNKNPAAIS